LATTNHWLISERIKENNLGNILGVLSLALTIWLGWDTIKERFRRWDKSTLEKLLQEIEAPNYIQQHRYVRDRDALIGFALMAVCITLAGLTFTGMYPDVKRPLVAISVMYEIFSGYIALLCFLSAINENKRATEAYVQNRLKKLSKLYEKYKTVGAVNDGGSMTRGFGN
jgi:hypothetical protein